MSAYKKSVKQICVDTEITYLYVKTNIINDFYRIIHDDNVEYCVLSCVYAFQKLFRVYYLSSGHPTSAFKVCHSSADYSLMTMHNCSTEGVTLYSTGSEVDRSEKTLYISKFHTAQKNLMACNEPILENGELRQCSRCAKCTRTLLQADLMGCLESFDESFDLDYYKKHQNYYWGYVYYKNPNDVFIREIKELLKKNRRVPPRGARIAGLIKIIKHGFKRGNPLAYTYRA